MRKLLAGLLFSVAGFSPRAASSQTEPIVRIGLEPECDIDYAAFFEFHSRFSKTALVPQSSPLFWRLTLLPVIAF